MPTEVLPRHYCSSFDARCVIAKIVSALIDSGNVSVLIFKI